MVVVGGTVVVVVGGTVVVVVGGTVVVVVGGTVVVFVGGVVVVVVVDDVGSVVDVVIFLILPLVELRLINGLLLRINLHRYVFFSVFRICPPLVFASTSL